MKCILHVGPPKTGSTAIQAFLRKNKEALLSRGILALADKELPRKLPFIFTKIPKLTPWAKRLKLNEPKQIEDFKKDTHSYIHNQIKRHKPDTLILSSEGLSRIPTADMTDMRNYLRSIASEIEIIFFLRRPDFRVLSGFKNMVRNKGYTGDIGSEYAIKLDDGKAIGELGDCFGSGNITPVVCMDSHPCKARAVGHIEALLEILFRGAETTPGDYVIPERRNIAWDYRAVYYMREFNKLAENNPELEKNRLPIGRLLQEHFSGGERIRVNTPPAKAGGFGVQLKAGSIGHSAD